MSAGRHALTPRPRGRLWWTLLTGAAFLASFTGYWLFDHAEALFRPWFSWFTVQFACYLIILLGFHKGWLTWGKHWIAIAVAARCLVIGSEPVMEADYFRYLWDGHVWSEGINPFAFAPEDEALDSIETRDRYFIQWMQYRTIYPAFAQLMFRLAHGLAPESLLGWKLLLFGYDAALALLLAAWIRLRSLPAHQLAWYLLNPLVLKEIFNSAHLDIIAVFWVSLAIYLFDRGRATPETDSTTRPLAWVSLAIAVATKVYPLVLIPLFLRFERKSGVSGWLARISGPAIVSAILLVLYLPFASAGSALVDSTGVFARYWTFNAGLFRGIDWIWDQIGNWAIELDLAGGGTTAAMGGLAAGGPASEPIPLFYQLPAKITVGVIFLGVLWWQRRRIQGGNELSGVCLGLLGWVLLLSPVVDAWYVLWILPLVVIEGHLGWLTFTYLVGMGYAWFAAPEAAYRYWVAEYALLGCALGAWLRVSRAMASESGDGRIAPSKVSVP